MTQTAPGSSTDHLDARHGRLTLAIAALATLATFLDTTILYVAFPDITATFDDASSSTLSWVLNSYTIVFAALLIPAGKLADRVGHRRAFLTGSVIFTAASMASGLAPTVEVLIAFRMFQAAGAAILIPSSLALVMRAFPPEKVTVAVAIWGAAGAVAGALGPTLGSVIVDGLGWRWAFYINLPVGAFTVIAGIRVLRESADPTVRVPSLLGVALIAGAAAAISYAVVEADAAGWASARTVLVLGSGLLLLWAFVVNQRQSDAPALNLDLFGINNFAWGNLTMFAFGLSFSAMFFGSILFLTDIWGWSIMRAGFGVAPGPALVALLAPRAGKLAGEVGQRPLLVLGGLFFASGGLWRIVVLGAAENYWVDYFPSMMLSGVAVALVFPQLASVVAQALPANRIGVGGAALQAVRQFGGTFGVALTIAFLGTPSGLNDALTGFDKIWWTIIAGGVLTSVLAWPLRTGPSAGLAVPVANESIT